MAQSPSQKEIDAYHEDGVVCVRGIIPLQELRTVNEAVEALLDEEPAPYDATLGHKVRYGDNTEKGDPGRAFDAVFMAEEISAFSEFARNKELASLARDLMGCESVRFYYDQLFAREPGTETGTRWHNDLPFWPFEGEDLISCWVALTPVTTESSGLEYVAGSHQWGVRYRPTLPWLADESLEPAPDFGQPKNRQGQRIVSWDMEPGDVLCHHPWVVHGAGTNHRTVRRVGLSLRYFGNDVRWAPREKTMTLPRDPRVAVGAYPADDDAFPIVG